METVAIRSSSQRRFCQLRSFRFYYPRSRMAGNGTAKRVKKEFVSITHETGWVAMADLIYLINLSII